MGGAEKVPYRAHGSAMLSAPSGELTGWGGCCGAGEDGLGEGLIWGRLCGGWDGRMDHGWGSGGGEVDGW